MSNNRWLFRLSPRRPPMLGDEIVWPFRDGELVRERERIRDAHRAAGAPADLSGYLRWLEANYYNKNKDGG